MHLRAGGAVECILVPDGWICTVIFATDVCGWGNRGAESPLRVGAGRKVSLYERFGGIRIAAVRVRIQVMMGNAQESVACARSEKVNCNQ